MRVSKAKIRQDIQAFMDTLRPYGITKPSQVVRLQLERTNGKDDWSPSDAYIRLMLSPRNEPEPGERFCNWFYALTEYIYEGMSRDTDTLALLAQSVNGGTSEYIRNVRFVTMPEDVTIEDFEVLKSNETGTLNLALIPSKLRRVCHWEECGRTFPGSPNQDYCCERHSQLADNKRRRDKRRAIREAQMALKAAA